MKLIVSYLKENAVIDVYDYRINQMMINVSSPGKPAGIFICEYSDKLTDHPLAKKFIEEILAGFE